MEAATINPHHSFNQKPSPFTGQRNLDAESPKIVHKVSALTAAIKLQKMYRSYRTRRRLADSVIVAEELWWQVLNFARLNHSTISFFNLTESVVSRWNRIDPRHRYGRNLYLYCKKWCESDAGQPFFYWLDVGDGRNVDLDECPRSLVRQQCIRYLGPKEREYFEYEQIEGKIVHKQTGELLDTSNGTNGEKWIFVMSTSKKLYFAQKRKGIFHHSSFLAGGATLAAGRYTAEKGVLKSISADSGHYKPSKEDLNHFLTFLGENGIDPNEVQVRSSDDPKQDQPAELKTVESESEVNVKVNDVKEIFKRTLSGGLQSPRAQVPQKEILKRIKSKREVNSYQLGNQLSLKWCSGVGPRIGCIADYPVELRKQAMDMVNLSPRLTCQSII